MIISLLRALNPVNLVNPVNHNKVLRRSLVCYLPVNVIVINRIMRIYMISGQVSNQNKIISYLPFLLRASNPVNPVNPVNHNKVLRRSLVLLSSRKCK